MEKITPDQPTKVNKAFGRTLVDSDGKPTSVEFNFTYKKFANIEDARQNGADFSDDDIVQMLNAKEKAKERAKAQNKALEAAGYELPNDDAQKLLRDMIRTLEVSKQYPGKEKETAERMLNTKYDDSLVLAPKVKATA